MAHVSVRALKTSLQTYAEPRMGAVRRRVDGRAARLGFAVAVAAATVVAYVSVADRSHTYVLFLLVVPISLLGEELGIRAGLTAAAAALVLATAVADQRGFAAGPTRVLTWAVVFTTASGVLRFLSRKADAMQDHPAAVAAGAVEAQQDEAALQVLSPREVEILGLIAEGGSNAQIAQRLVISAGTVKSHVHQILHKLGAANRTEAAFIYHRARRSTGR